MNMNQLLASPSRVDAESAPRLVAMQAFPSERSCTFGALLAIPSGMRTPGSQWCPAGPR
jgi:hypothetical protein